VQLYFVARSNNARNGLIANSGASVFIHIWLLFLNENRFEGSIDNL